MKSDEEQTLFIIKYGEIGLKGRNRIFFLKKLQTNILDQLRGLPGEVTLKKGRLFLEARARDSDAVQGILSRVFGIVSFSQAVQVDKDIPGIKRGALQLADEHLSSESTFKIEARRTDKSFPLDSYGIACLLGDLIRERIPGIRVNLRAPDRVIHVEIRDSAYMYAGALRGPGGLPVGSLGRGVLLLSGGIDSPVAGYLMAKRGLRIDSVYFHTHPYTSPRVRDKVESLSRILLSYMPSTTLLVVPYTDIQVKIKEQAHAEEATLLSRACMMKIAALIAEHRRALCLVTGESLGQVASQTIQGMTFTGSRSHLPVFRPLIGMDKVEIIGIAQRIGTYETSILPYPDCCTLFASPHPLIHPRFSSIMKSFSALGLDSLIQEAARKAEAVSLPEGQSEKLK